MARYTKSTVRAKAARCKLPFALRRPNLLGSIESLLHSTCIFLIHYSSFSPIVVPSDLGSFNLPLFSHPFPQPNCPPKTMTARYITPLLRPLAGASASSSAFHTQTFVSPLLKSYTRSSTSPFHRLHHNFRLYSSSSMASPDKPNAFFDIAWADPAGKSTWKSIAIVGPIGASIQPIKTLRIYLHLLTHHLFY